jgi:DNA topoisomerase-3
MKLYIAEKEMIGKAIAEAISGEKKRSKTYIECGDIVIAWLQGHVISLCDPEEYDERYKKWSNETLLYVPQTWKYKISKGKEIFVKNVRDLLKTADSVVNVGDPDREGQLLVDEVLEYCGWKGETLRMWLNDNHPDTIKKALKELEDNEKYKGLYNAGRARAYSDWLVGLALTRLATLQFRSYGYNITGAVSVGRVQTPTLGLVVRRNEEINNFVSKDYWIFATELTFPDGRVILGKWQKEKDKDYDFLDENNRIIDQNELKKLEALIENKQGIVVSVKKELKKKNPPLPFNLPQIQIAANKKYKIKNTLEHVQKLYELGYVSYPRTNIRYLPEVRFSEAKEIINMIDVALTSLSGAITGVDVSRKSPAWNDSEVKEHYGIIPTKKAPKLNELSEMEKNIYEMICLRYILQFLPEYQYEQTTIDYEVEGLSFRALGRNVLDIGWQGWDIEEETESSRKNDEDKEEIRKELPMVKKNETGTINVKTETKKTTPPKPFTYGTLLEAMNSIHKYVTDPEIKKKLKEVSGIGTPATQQNILATIFNRGYVEERKDKIYPTIIGILLIKSLEDSKAALMATPDLTASWENTMDMINESKETLSKFIAETIVTIKEIISVPFKVKEIQGIEIAKRKNCLMENCGGYLSLRKGRDNKNFFSCDICGKTFSEKDGEPIINEKKVESFNEAPCPKGCGKNARQYEGKYGKYWRCICSPEETFKDIDGKPTVQEKKKIEKIKCPVPRCKGDAVKLHKKSDGTPFWKCDTCQNFFNDIDGKPVMKQEKKSSNAK